ncbi:MAG: molybdopterin-dependent oxidoreductase [Ignavibacteria bacterium]|jgi:NADH-quinone oxidoreductase subunit G|nr:molybdopterin-dependent oxidoreductase [Ignavibacteria bacterium]MCU7503562.1 molybdopterin-dependent oxidoreductase [Ignavibacteria bacterium]MCU7516784.1 molybdopterin-dependent oxidoreductase [Ignavibacteria bacterium]
MPKITINGQELEFKAGQTVIEVARQNGISVPHFCWHPALSVSGNCRMCLVEIEKMPKLAIACSTLASDGMVVHVDSEKAVSARNAVMEFLLINHPLDCPVCDQAGECKLQDYAYRYSSGESRFEEEKQHNKKRVELGPFVMFDAERCISCSRCIRFCDEIAGDKELTFTKRGDRVTISTYPGEELDNPYSLNTTDICPVGALTSRDFRFKARVWDMSKTNSICTGCARGCNDEIWVKNNIVLRLTPRFNKEVNSYWMCDEGRLNTFKFINNQRVDGPHIRRNGQIVKTGYDEAVAFTVSQLKAYNPGEIAFLGSAFASCEDNYMLAKLAKGTLHVKNIDFARHLIPGSADGILICDDKAPNSLGAELSGVKPAPEGLNFEGILEGINSGKIKVLYCLEDDIAAMSPEYENTLSKLDFLVVHATNHNATTVLADVIFPAAAFAEKNGTMVNFQGRLQRLKPAVATIDMDRSLEGMEMSRLDKFGTDFDKWAKKNRVDARASWKMLQTVGSLMGLKMKHQISEEVFADMASCIEAFHGLDYDVIGESGIKIKVNNTAKATK